jgi:hypothetical protein
MRIARASSTGVDAALASFAVAASGMVARNSSPNAACWTLFTNFMLQSFHH